MAEVKVDAKHVPAAVQLGVGDTLVISLQENPTTGYRWQASAGNHLVPSGDEFLSPRESTMGAGGTRMLKFGVISAGNGEVKLQLRREWETATPQASIDIKYQIQ